MGFIFPSMVSSICFLYSEYVAYGCLLHLNQIDSTISFGTGATRVVFLHAYRYDGGENVL
jgi:hypothetical protein